MRPAGSCWAAVGHLDMGNRDAFPGSPPVTASKSQCLSWGIPTRVEFPAARSGKQRGRRNSRSIRPTLTASAGPGDIPDRLHEVLHWERVFNARAPRPSQPSLACGINSNYCRSFVNASMSLFRVSGGRPRFLSSSCFGRRLDEALDLLPRHLLSTSTWPCYPWFRVA
jgi:hypothetical protein